MLYSDDEGESDDDSRLAVTTAWGLRVARRGSLGLTQNFRNIPDSRERLALDITLLKQQYAKLRERQRQAHIILTAACARQTVNQTQSSAMQMNQFLLGRSAILPKGRRIGPPPGSVPPARKIIAPKPVKSNLKPPKRGETLHWKDTELTQRRKNSLKWKGVNAERGSFNQDDGSEKSDKEVIQSTSSASSTSNMSDVSQSSPSRARKKSESSSYSEESDEKSSTSTSLCDDENFKGSQCSSLEQSPIKKKISPEIEVPEGNKSEDIQKYIDSIKETFRLSDDEEEIDDVIIEETKLELIEIEKENLIDINFDEKKTDGKKEDKLKEFMDEILVPDEVKETSEIDGLDKLLKSIDEIPSLLPPIQIICSSQDNSEISSSEHSSLNISSISQLSPIPDISKYISMSSISPLRTPSSLIDYSDYMNVASNDSSERSSTTINLKTDEISYEGVTNELFERMNSAERPTRLDIPVTGLGLHKTYSLDSHQPSCSSSSYTIELQVKTDSPIILACTDISSIKSPMKNSFHEIDRLKFLKEKSFSLDEPAKDKETLQATSCPEIRADVVSKKNSDRVLKIIQENSMILHRILKKNSSDSLIEEVSDEEKREQTEEDSIKIDCKIQTPIITKSPDFHFKEFTSFVKNSPSIEKLFEETFDEPSNSEISSKIESPEYISKESKAIVEKFPSFEKLSEISSFEGRDSSYEDRLRKIDKMYSPDYLSSESRDTSVPELKSFETENEGISREASCKVISPKEDSKEFSAFKVSSTTSDISKKAAETKEAESFCSKKSDISEIESSEKISDTKLADRNVGSKIKDEKMLSFEQIEKEPPFSTNFSRTSKLSDCDEISRRKDEYKKNDSPNQAPCSKNKSFEYTSKHDSVDYGESSFKSVKKTNPISNPVSDYPISKSREKIFEFDPDFCPKSNNDEIKKSVANPTDFEKKEVELESSYTSSKSREFDTNLDCKSKKDTKPNIEKEVELESNYSSSKSREKIIDFDSKLGANSKNDAMIPIEKKEKEVEPSYPISKSREKIFDSDSNYCPESEIYAIKASLIQNISKPTEIEKKVTDFALKSKQEYIENIDKELKSSSKSREKIFEIDSELESTNKNVAISLTMDIYPRPKSRENILELDPDFCSKSKNYAIEDSFTKINPVEFEKKEIGSSYSISKSREKSFDSEETKDYFSYKSKLDSDKNQTSKYDFYSSKKSSSFSLNLNPDSKPKDEANISETLSSIENTIQTINNLCQVKEVPIVSVEDTDHSKNLSIKHFLTENSDWNRTRDRSSSRSHRDFKRDASPRRRRDEEIEEYQSRLSRQDPNVAESSFDFYNKSGEKRIPERPEIRHTTVTCTFYDRFLSQKLEKSSKLDKSPSSPIITKSYLESLRPTSSSTDRIVKSAENSPSRLKYDSPTITKPAVISSLHNFNLTKKEVRSCDNILEKVKQSSRNFSPLPLKPHSPSELGLKLGLYKTPSPIKTTPKS